MIWRAISALLLLISPIIRPNTSPKCEHLVHLGDSTTISILPWLESDYRSMGFKDVTIHAVNGGSIWYPSGSSGVDAARRYKQPNTCWVVALGTNDSASTSVRNWNARFDSIMSVIGKDPVVWVNVWYDSPTRANYDKRVASWWNTFLVYKQSRYSIRIFDWATIAKSHPSWFIYDGLHYTDRGSKERSYWITRSSALLLSIH